MGSSYISHHLNQMTYKDLPNKTGCYIITNNLNGAAFRLYKK